MKMLSEVKKFCYNNLYKDYGYLKLIFIILCGLVLFEELQGVSKKMVFSGKTAIITFKIIQNAKVGGVLENSGYLLPDGH